MRLARRRRLIQKRQDKTYSLISRFCRLPAIPGMSLDGRRPRRIGEAPPSGVREDPVKLVEVVIILVCLAEACRRGTPPGRPESTEIPSGPRRRGAGLQEAPAITESRRSFPTVFARAPSG